jgi:multidrug efflux pump subunit AcrA (membrane-fusion protein)/YHS domain-containing protein
MNKPAIVGSAIVLGLAAFVAGRITSAGSSSPQSSSAKRILYYVDPMHPAYRSDKPGIAPDCGMALEPVFEGDDPAAKLQLAPGAVSLSPESQQRIGARVETVARNSGSRTIRTTGRIQADDNRVYRLMAVTEGRVQSLGDNPVGTIVHKNQVLATFYSREFRNAEQAYLGSLTSIDRLKSAGRDPEDSTKSGDANLRINEEQLRALGMGDPQIKELSKTRQITQDIEVTSPVDGVVLARNISREERFDGHIELYRVADISKIWILADLLGDEGNLLHSGARVRVTARELGKNFYATVSSTPPVFDPVSRTLKLRLEADNPGLNLRPDMFVDIEFDSKAPAGLSVPADAVLDSGLHKIVYVESSEGVFEPRAVEVGEAFGGRVAVKKGLSEGDRVVTAGNFMIDSESRMRAPAQQTAKAPAAMDSSTMAKASGMAHDMKDESSGQPKMASMHEKISGPAASESNVDPACGMPLSAADAKSAKYSAVYHGHKFVFCSKNCKKKFESDPEKYTGEKAQTTSSAQAGIGAP